MKPVTISGEIENAYGKPLSELKTKSGQTLNKLPYSGSYEEYVSIEEVRKANDMPNDDEVVKYRNAQRKANERQKAMQVALDAAEVVKPTIENDDQLRLKKMFELFVANGASEAEAKTKAAAALGLEWAE